MTSYVNMGAPMEDGTHNEDASPFYDDQQPYISQVYDKEVRRGFVKKVYGVLSAQLLLTFLVALPFSLHYISEQWVVDNQWLMLFSMVMSLAVVCAGACKPDLFRRYPNNYILLGIFTFFESICVGMVTAFYTTDSVLYVFFLTGAIFACLTYYARTTDTDFTGMGNYLAMALIGICLVGFIMCFFPGGVMEKIYAGAAAILFSAYIVYDTQLIMGGDHKMQFQVDDYVFAALNIYLDVLNLFLELLRLLGERNN